MSDWAWVEEIISYRYTPQMELPEDSMMYFLNKHPILQEMIDKLDLAMEL